MLYCDRGAANLLLGQLLENHESMGKAEKHYISAIQYFNKAIGQSPSYVKAYKYRGLARQRIGLKKEADADSDTVDRLTRAGYGEINDTR